MDGKSIGLFKHESGVTPSSIVNEAFMEIFVWTNEFIFPEVFKKDLQSAWTIYLGFVLRFCFYGHEPY